MDEPTAGLDWSMRATVSLLAKLKTLDAVGGHTRRWELLAIADLLDAQSRRTTPRYTYSTSPHCGVMPKMPQTDSPLLPEMSDLWQQTLNWQTH